MAAIFMSKVARRSVCVMTFRFKNTDKPPTLNELLRRQNELSRKNRNADDAQGVQGDEIVKDTKRVAEEVPVKDEIVYTESELRVIQVRRELDEKTADALHEVQEDEKRKKGGGEADPGLG